MLGILSLDDPDHAQSAGPSAFRLVMSTAETTASPMATSYDTICALGAQRANQR